MSGCDGCSWAPVVGALVAMALVASLWLAGGAIAGGGGSGAGVPADAGGASAPQPSVAEERLRVSPGTADVASQLGIAQQPDPIAACTAEPSTATPGETVTLNASGSENAEGYEWDLDGDGTIDTDRYSTATFDHAYQEPGDYQPSVTVYGFDGEQTDTAPCGDVTIEPENEPPAAAFSVSPRPAEVGTPTTFDASGSSDPDGTIDEYRWDFDDDGVPDVNTSDATTTHTFYESGFRNVLLTVEDDDGAVDTAGVDLDVLPPGPTARCTAEPAAAAPGETVSLDASASENAESYEWDLDGDGTWDTDRYTTAVYDHQYEETGDYTPRVRAIAAGGERQDTAPCGDVTIDPENQPPEASFSISPRPAVAGSATTFDATASSDPDGTISEYRWEFGGGTTETTSDPITTNTYSQTGWTGVTLTVEDDDGATDTTGADLEVVPGGPVARCTAEPQEAQPGETVVLDAAESENAEGYEWDLDGDGTIDTDRFGQPTYEHQYEEPGEYEPTVTVYGPDGERTSTAPCGPIVVEGENEPPNAVLTVQGDAVAPEEPVILDASGSSDPDGRIVSYAWDLDGDGTADDTTSTPVLNTSFDATGNYTVTVTVEDDDGATDSDEATVTVVAGGGQNKGQDGLPIPELLVPGLIGGGAGYAACRARNWQLRGFPNPFGRGDGPSGVTAHATGTFQTPGGSGTVSVAGLGFEPDVVLLTASSSVVGEGPGLDRTDAWSYGAVTRDTDGSLSQQALAVATDARTTGRGFATAVSDGCLELPLHTDEEVVTLSGTVGATHEGGFEVGFDASELPAERYDEEYVVQFEAFETRNPADANVGFFTTPEQKAVQSVDLGIEADYVRLTALDPLGEIDATVETGERVGVSHGQAAAEASITQRAVTGAVDPTTAGHTCHGAFEDRALHLLHGDHGSIDGRTSARVTDLGRSLELTFDQVHVGAADDPGGEAGSEDDPAGSGSDGSTGDGDDAEPTAPPRLVGFVALDTGDGPSPSLGRIEAPADAGPERVDVGFEPQVIEFTATTMADVGEESSVTRSPLGFGWSHGTALIDAAGVVHHSVLHGSVDSRNATGSGPLSTPATRAEAGQLGGVAPPGATGVPVDAAQLAATGAIEDLPGDVSPSGGPASGERTDGGRPKDGRTDGGAPDAADTAAGASEEAAERAGLGAGALGYVVDAAGRVRRREDVRVVGVDRTGFAVERRRLGDDTTAEAGLSRPVVFYTAWPEATEGEL